ncbi:MAG: outer membrane lipid asymmetry maintenance protein MlaD [Holosporales bacterium]|jgi:phospholipid/cholesterol/gamma-HCH transport system substrate-binding protein|nr:outer membrane lipid asymmetry maintenance protein MlaD [Holosporales bacterium]
MENSRAFESLIGFAVIVITALFAAYAFNYSKLNQEDGYILYAKFDNISGIDEGSEVRLGGIKIGSVVDISLDSESYLAKVAISVKNNVKLPKDTVVKIDSEGLLGGKYLNLDPGSDEEFLKPGEEITRTQSSLSLESLIGKFLLSTNGSEKKAGG